VAQMPRNSGLVKLRTGHPPAESGFKTGNQTTARLGHLFLFGKNAKLKTKKICSRYLLIFKGYFFCRFKGIPPLIEGNFILKNCF